MVRPGARYETLSMKSASAVHLFAIIFLVALFAGSSGCRREPDWARKDILRIGDHIVHYDSDPLAPGFVISFGLPLVTDNDIECIYLLPAREIKSLDMSGTKVTDSGLEQLKDFLNLRELKLRGTNISDEGLRHLAALKELRSLELENTQIMGPGLGHLKSLPKLESLDLSKTKLTDSGLEHARGLKQIKVLSIRNTAVTDQGLSHVVALTQLESLSVGPMTTAAGLEQLDKLIKLRRLSVGGIINDDSSFQKLQQSLPGIEIVASRFTRDKSPPVASLTQEQAIEEIERLEGSVIAEKNDSGKAMYSVYLYAPADYDDTTLELLEPLDSVYKLHLAGGWLSNEDLQSIPQLKQLQCLSLRGDTWSGDKKPQPLGSWYWPEERDTWINDAGLQYIGECTQLYSLDLTSTYVTDDGLHHINRLIQLKELGLRNLAVTGVGLKELRALKNLCSLDLSHTVIDDDALEQLQAFPQLRVLWIGRTLVTDAGMKKLLSLNNLQFLDLNHTAITDASINDLCSIKSLRGINLDYTLVTEKGVAPLRKAFPKLRITAEGIGDRAPRATDAELKERHRPFH